MPNLYTVTLGQFGKVFKGVLKSNDGFEDTEIAIKAPKVNLISSDSVNDFYREANTAVSFDHINVLKCLGMSEEPKELPYLIFEFMHFGDLATILASNRVNGQSEKAPLLTQVILKRYLPTKAKLQNRSVYSTQSCTINTIKHNHTQLHNRTIKMPIFAQSHNQNANFRSIAQSNFKFCKIKHNHTQSNTVIHNQTKSFFKAFLSF